MIRKIVFPMFFFLSGVPMALAEVRITEFTIPTEGRAPARIVLGPDANLWFTEGSPDGGLGRITTEGVITEFPLPPSDNRPYLGPIVAGSDGALWFRSKAFNAVDRMSTSGAVTSLSLAPHGGVTEMTKGPDGLIWYSECLSIDRISAEGVVTSFRLPFAQDPNIEFCTVLGWPQGIATGPDGNVWFAVNGRASDGDHPGAIGRITPEGVMDFFSDGHSRPEQIVTGPDGNLWFTDSINSSIGRVTPSGVMDEFRLYQEGAGPSSITSGPDGALWFTERDFNAIGRISTIGDITDFVLATPHARPTGIAAGPDGNIWFTESTTNRIGRLDVASANGSCEPGSNALCLAGNRFRVAAAWAGAGAGQSGTGWPHSATPTAGYFWFFDPANIEVFVKVLDNCATTGGYSVYVNGLTHLNVTVTVTDVVTGVRRDYVNPLGKGFELIYDAETFRDCR